MPTDTQPHGGQGALPAPAPAPIERAYARGDHALARRLARQLLARLEGDPRALARAREVLAATEPDPFIFWLGAVGLGLVAWLVYKYVP